MLYLRWISHCVSHPSLCLQCDIALRNSFSQNKSMIVYIYLYYRCNTFCPNIIVIYNICGVSDCWSMMPGKTYVIRLTPSVWYFLFCISLLGYYGNNFFSSKLSFELGFFINASGLSLQSKWTLWKIEML